MRMRTALSHVQLLNFARGWRKFRRRGLRSGSFFIVPELRRERSSNLRTLGKSAQFFVYACQCLFCQCSFLSTPRRAGIFQFSSFAYALSRWSFSRPPYVGLLVDRRAGCLWRWYPARQGWIVCQALRPLGSRQLSTLGPIVGVTSGLARNLTRGLLFAAL